MSGRFPSTEEVQQRAEEAKLAARLQYEDRLAIRHQQQAKARELAKISAAHKVNGSPLWKDEVRVFDSTMERIENHAALTRAHSSGGRRGGALPAEVVEAVLAEEHDELRALREQRRLLEEEERRVRATYQLQKEVVHDRKAALHAAQAALKRRKHDQKEERRQQLLRLQELRKQQEAAVTALGNGLLAPPAPTIRHLHSVAMTQRLGGSGSGSGSTPTAGSSRTL